MNTTAISNDAKPGGKLVLGFSGGLDTSFCALYLKEQGYDVHTITVNTGGFSPDEVVYRGIPA